MSRHRRIFTLEEANACLPQVEAILAVLTKKKEDCSRLHDQLLMHELLVQEGPLGPFYNPGKSLEHEARGLDDTLTNDLKKEIEHLREIGCVIRDLEKGWVDFPGKYQNQDVYFSWKRGEKAIQYYRGMTDKFEKRKPIHT